MRNTELIHLLLTSILNEVFHAKTVAKKNKKQQLMIVTLIKARERRAVKVEDWLWVQ